MADNALSSLLAAGLTIPQIQALGAEYARRQAAYGAGSPQTLFPEEHGGSVNDLIGLGGGYGYLPYKVQQQGIQSTYNLGLGNLGLSAQQQRFNEADAMAQEAANPANIVKILDLYSRTGEPIPVNNAVLQNITPDNLGGPSDPSYDYVTKLLQQPTLPNNVPGAARGRTFRVGEPTVGIGAFTGLPKFTLAENGPEEMGQHGGDVQVKPLPGVSRQLNPDEQAAMVQSVSRFSGLGTPVTTAPVSFPRTTVASRGTLGTLGTMGTGTPVNGPAAGIGTMATPGTTALPMTAQDMQSDFDAFHAGTISPQQAQRDYQRWRAAGGTSPNPLSGAATPAASRPTPTMTPHVPIAGSPIATSEAGFNAAFLAKRGDPNYNPLYDADGDGQITMLDGAKLFGQQPVPMARGGKFIAGAIKKPGALHRELGVPAGQKIPAGRLAKAAKAGGKLGQRARFAETLKGFAAGGDLASQLRGLAAAGYDSPTKIYQHIQQTQGADAAYKAYEANNPGYSDPGGAFNAGQQQNYSFGGLGTRQPVSVAGGAGGGRDAFTAALGAASLDAWQRAHPDQGVFVRDPATGNTMPNYGATGTYAGAQQAAAAMGTGNAPVSGSGGQTASGSGGQSALSAAAKLFAQGLKGNTFADPRYVAALSAGTVPGLAGYTNIDRFLASLDPNRKSALQAIYAAAGYSPDELTFGQQQNAPASAF